ncbi:cytochrome P450 [Pseudonocardia xishanensis]|uniref:Cytochrome P450 n=1 Tax=Pseudonocardia xishanensis TaxID=630995 RepID=A0ABP8RZ15_9PSEU
MNDTTRSDLERELLTFIHDSESGDPHDIYRRIREVDPVFWSPRLNAWLVTGYDHVSALTMDPIWSSSTFSSEDMPPGTLSRGPGFCQMDMMPQRNDDPVHGQLRKLTLRLFNGKAAEQRRPQMRQIAADVLEGIEPGVEFDFLSQVTYRIALLLACDIIGLPPSDIPQLREWVERYTRMHGATVTEADQASADAMFTEFGEYVDAVIAGRDGAGDDRRDAIDAFRIARAAGDIEQDVMVANVFNIMFGSHETTANLLGNGLYKLLEEREQWALLASDPDSYAPGAVEEVLRYCSPSTNLLARYPLEDAELGGHTIKKGQRVMGCLVAADRDPAQFPDPDRFDITRKPNRHIAFGKGRHLCLGAPFARVEAQEVFTELVRRFPNLELAEPVSFNQSWTLRGFTRLMLRVPLASEARVGAGV